MRGKSELRPAVITHVALLRAVNVGGSKRLAMADLRAFFTSLGFESVETMLQSGNVVFASRSGASKELESRLEARAATDLDLETDFFVRSTRQWHALVRHNPFRREAKSNPSKLASVFLNSQASARAVESLRLPCSRPRCRRCLLRSRYLQRRNGTALAEALAGVPRLLCLRKRSGRQQHRGCPQGAVEPAHLMTTGSQGQQDARVSNEEPVLHTARGARRRDVLASSCFEASQRDGLRPRACQILSTS